jgi:hypothetical protein
MSVEAPTREKALAKLQQQLKKQLQNGTELVSLEVTQETHPLAEFVGMFKDDPNIADWRKSMADYRRRIDEHPERP